MAFTGNFLCTSFKTELLKGVHNFTATTGNTFNVALYDNSASFTAATTAYTTSNEISGTNYSAKGQALNPVTPTASGTTALVDFADVSYSNSTISASGAIIYNSSASNKAIAIISFGGTVASTAGTFSITMPAADASNALIRIA